MDCTMSCGSVLIVAALWGSVMAQDPKVTISHTEPETYIIGGGNMFLVNARRNQDVSLSCFVEDLAPNLEVRWRKNYVQNGEPKRTFISRNMANTDVTKYSIEKPTIYTWRLRIKDIQILDEGEYECFVQLTGLSTVSAFRYVSVLVAPSLIPSETSADKMVEEGDETLLMCNATGRPYPMIEWTRLGGAMLPNGKERHMGDTLRLPSTSPSHRGEYRCDVWNSVGHIQRIISLDVRFAPVVRVEAEEIYQAPGYATELQCLIEANPKPSDTQMKWIKDGLSYTLSTGKYFVRRVEGAFNRINYEMIIDGVEEEDYGTYICQVSNSMTKDGPATKRVRLIKSETPVVSSKLGREVKGGEWRKRFNNKVSSAPSNMVSIATVVMCLCALVMQH